METSDKIVLGAVAGLFVFISALLYVDYQNSAREDQIIAHLMLKKVTACEAILAIKGK